MGETKDLMEVLEGYDIEVIPTSNTLNIVGNFNEDMLQMVYGFVNNLDEESDEPIKINITSEGGSADVLNAIIDLLRSTNRQLHATVHGYAYSSALGLFCACHKRKMGDLAKLLYHNCIYTIEGGLQHHKDALEDSLRIQDEYDKLILAVTNGVTKEDLSQHKYRDWIINKSEAINLGIVNSL
ncbi:MAG: ATP-dependent Clp protease proteolytic subunit [Cetobacterium sp.]